MLASILASLLAATGPGLSAQSAVEPVFRADFEQAALGQPPPGWHVGGSAPSGFEVEVSAERPFAGARCVHSKRAKEGAREGFGNLIDGLDATPCRGKRIALRAVVRAEGGARGQMWLRIDGPGQESRLIDNMFDRPVTGAEWRRCALVGDVAPGAEKIVIGLMHFGPGELWLDDVEVTILGPAGTGDEAPRPLDERGLANLTAFARLFGYVRHFHPSDAAAEAAWAGTCVAGVRAVESARDAESLARVLQELFAPLAPTLRVFDSRGTPPPPAPELTWPADAGRPRVIRWDHTGYGTETSRLYRSVRDTERVLDGKVPAGWREPAQTYDADLGGGVVCRVPIVLYRDMRGTLPHAEAATKRASSIDDPPALQASDRATRIADVVMAWNVFEHFYPYFDVVKADWPAELSRALRSAATDADESAFLDTLRRLVAGLHDGHGDVSHPGDANYALPPCAWGWAEGQLVITALGSDGTRGLQVGDVVRAIDGVATDAAYQRVRATTSASTEQHARSRSLRELAYGKPGSTLRLAILRRDGGEHEVELVRRAGVAPVEEPRPAKIAALEPGIWYVDLDRITDEDFETALPNLEAARGIVFDLRGYPSGLSTIVIAHLIGEPARSPSWNVPRIHEPDRRDMTFDEDSWEVAPKAPRLKAKIAFVIDGRAISYAETYMGIVERYRLAAIVGEATAGTNGNVNPFTLPGGYSITWTGMKVLRHDGTPHHGVGIRPTIPVARTVAGIAAGRDEFLERAVQAVRD